MDEAERRKARRGKQRREYQRKRAEGECYSCTAPVEAGRTRCRRHLDMIAGYVNADPKARRTKQRRRRRKLKAKGLCIVCEAPAAPDRVRCEACLQDHRDDGERYRARKRQEQLSAFKPRKKPCARCGAPFVMTPRWRMLCGACRGNRVTVDDTSHSLTL